MRKRISTWCGLLACFVAFVVSGCARTEYIVAKPDTYGYVSRASEAWILWPDGKGGFTEAQGQLPPGTVVLVPKGPTTRP